MPPSLKDWSARLDAQREAQRQADARQQLVIKQATVKAELLMQHEGWDYYLSVLQAKLEEAKAEEVTWMQRAATALHDHDVKLAQIHYHTWKARVEAFEEVMALPSQWRGQDAQNSPAGQSSP